ncbi:MAG: DNA mismatch repair protein MutS, partial [Vampirovibrionales bacterium]
MSSFIPTPSPQGHSQTHEGDSTEGFLTQYPLDTLWQTWLQRYLYPETRLPSEQNQEEAQAHSLSSDVSSTSGRWQTMCTWHIPEGYFTPAGQGQLTPMIRQFLHVKHTALGQLLLYRMGDFYEAFFEDALVLAGVLDITLTARDAGVLGKIPMAGIPVKALEFHVPTLLHAGFTTALCEQVEPAEQTKGLMARRIIRTLSPGTLIEEAWVQSEQAQILAAVHTQGSQAGIAYTDITTGSLHAMELPVEELLTELERLRAVEILIAGVQKKVHWHLGPSGGVIDWVPVWPQAWYENPSWKTQLETLSQQYPWKPKASVIFEPSHYTPYLKRWFQVSTLEGVTDKERYPLSTHALGALAVYIHQMFPEGVPTVTSPRIEERSQQVYLNRSARHHLELFKTARHERQEHSLFQLLNHTFTPMGTRLLRQWVSTPLQCKATLEARHTAVGLLREGLEATGCYPLLRKDLTLIRDVERLVRKLQHGKLTPKDMMSLAQSLQGLESLSQTLQHTLAQGASHPLLEKVYHCPPELLEIKHLLVSHLVEHPPQNLKDISLEQPLIRSGIDPVIDELRDILTHHDTWLSSYEQTQREHTGIKTLKVSHHQVFGYFIEISRSALAQFTQQGHTLPETYHRKQTLASVERYGTPALKAFEEKKLEAAEALEAREYACFQALWDALLPHTESLLAMAQAIATFDVLQSFAWVAQSHGYTCPTLTEAPKLHLKGIRHPILETLLPLGQFVANDCHCASRVLHSSPRDSTFNTEEKLPAQVLMITGPNMAGKSTYMRQVAL